MPAELKLPERSLLDRPQRLGFLPTLWFWDDGVRQRELLPIVLPITLLVVLLTDYLAGRFPGFAVLWSALVLLHPFVVMGMVERYIRKQLRLRPAADRLASALESPARRPLSQLVPLAVGGSAAVLLASATIGNAAALVVLAFLVVLGTAVRRRERRRLELDAGADGLHAGLTMGSPRPLPRRRDGPDDVQFQDTAPKDMAGDA
jgi:hypothetical protein